MRAGRSATTFGIRMSVRTCLCAPYKRNGCGLAAGASVEVLLYDATLPSTESLRLLWWFGGRESAQEGDATQRKEEEKLKNGFAVLCG